MSHALKRMQLLYLCLLECSVSMRYLYAHAVLQRSSMHTPYGYTTEIAAVVERRYQQLWRSFVLLWSGNNLYYLVQQIRNIVCRCLVVFSHPSLLGTSVDNREVELVFCCIKREHKVENHLINLLRSAVGLVHLVDDDYRFQSYLQCFLQDKSCLWHWSLKRIDKQQTSVCHVKHTFHLAAEVCVSRSVDDVYLCVLIGY